MAGSASWVRHISDESVGEEATTCADTTPGPSLTKVKVLAAPAGSVDGSSIRLWNVIAAAADVCAGVDVIEDVPGGAADGPAGLGLGLWLGDREPSPEDGAEALEATVATATPDRGEAVGVGL